MTKYSKLILFIQQIPKKTFNTSLFYMINLNLLHKEEIIVIIMGIMRKLLKTP